MVGFCASEKITDVSKAITPNSRILNLKEEAHVFFIVPNFISLQRYKKN